MGISIVVKENLKDLDLLRMACQLTHDFHYKEFLEMGLHASATVGVAALGQEGRKETGKRKV